MQDNSNSNVVSLFDRKPKAAPQALVHTDNTQASGELNFHEVMRKNAENQKRLQQDRLKANQSVLRSYRIKK